MDERMQTGAITEVQGSQNVAYILNDNSLFLTTGYKVLKSQEKNGFVKCAKLLYNGKVKLLYFTAGYKSLENLLPVLDGDSFLSIALNLFNVILEIRSNGFLTCQNLDVSFDKIFIDQSTMTVNLIYLPINTPPADPAAFEYELRTRLKKLITSTPSLMAGKMNHFYEELTDGSLSLDELYKHICAGSKGMPGGRERRQTALPGKIPAKPSGGAKPQPQLIFSAINAPAPVAFHIDRPEFTIGKSTSGVDGSVSFNKAISRIHCKVVYQNGGYYIMDLGSANGTYVNNCRVGANQMQAVKNGDVIRLANSDFMIQI